MFPHPKVREAFQSFIKVPLYLPEPKDERVSARNEELWTKLANQESLPSYAIVDPKTEAVLDLFFFEDQFIRDPATFAARLDRAVAARK